MISLDYNDKAFQEFLRKELNLSRSAAFHSRKVLDGTQLYEYSLGTIKDGDRTFVLVKGTFVATKSYVVIKTAFSDDFQFPLIAKELDEKGIDPKKTRIAMVAVNTPGDVKDAETNPQLQVVMIPF